MKPADIATGEHLRPILYFVFYRKREAEAEGSEI
jgi:hypothetical protein